MAEACRRRQPAHPLGRRGRPRPREGWRWGQRRPAARHQPFQVRDTVPSRAERQGRAPDRGGAAPQAATRRPHRHSGPQPPDRGPDRTGSPAERRRCLARSPSARACVPGWAAGVSRRQALGGSGWPARGRCRGMGTAGPGCPGPGLVRRMRPVSRRADPVPHRGPPRVPARAGPAGHRTPRRPPSPARTPRARRCAHVAQQPGRRGWWTARRAHPRACLPYDHPSPRYVMAAAAAPWLRDRPVGELPARVTRGPRQSRRARPEGLEEAGAQHARQLQELVGRGQPV